MRPSWCDPNLIGLVPLEGEEKVPESSLRHSCVYPKSWLPSAFPLGTFRGTCSVGLGIDPKNLFLEAFQWFICMAEFRKYYFKWAHLTLWNCLFFCCINLLSIPEGLKVPISLASFRYPHATEQLSPCTTTERSQPQLLKPVCLKPVLHSKRSHQNEERVHCG